MHARIIARHEFVSKIWQKVFMMMVRSCLVLFLVAFASAGDMACLKMNLWANEDCSGDPDNASTVTVGTTPSEACGKYCMGRPFLAL